MRYQLFPNDPKLLYLDFRLSIAFQIWTKSQLIFDWQQILHSEPLALHYRRTLRRYEQRTLGPSKVELSIEEHFGYAAGDPTPRLKAKLRLPHTFQLVSTNIQILWRSDRAESIASAALEAGAR